MINVFFHNISTNDFMEDNVVLNNKQLPEEGSSLGIVFKELNTNNDIYNRMYISYMNAFPWIEEKLDPINWQNKTYIPALIPFASNGQLADIKTPRQIIEGIEEIDAKALREVLSEAGYFSDYIAADTFEEKLCWVLLSVALQTKFYTED